MLKLLRNQHGASAVFVAVSLIAFMGCGAIAVDVFHFIVVKNELQNAADAGALAGASALYRDTLGISVDPNANTDALAAATANTSDWVAVEVLNPTANECACPSNYNRYDTECEDRYSLEHEDVQRGHWSFVNSSAGYPVTQDDAGFWCNPTTVAKNLSQYNYDQLNADTDFINSVRVVTRRHGTPVLTFFSRIFRLPAPVIFAESVAYIGFATLNTQVAAPIAICEDTIKNWGTGQGLECNEGRMYNANNDTARWTNLTDCSSSTNADLIKDLVSCGNFVTIDTTTGELGTTEGMVQSAFDILYDCWLNGSNQIDIGQDENGDNQKEPVSIDENIDSIPDQPWTMVLPVINCDIAPNCAPLTGLVEIEVVWLATKDQIDSTNPSEPGAPNYMHYNLPEYNPESSTYDNGMVYGPVWPDDWPDNPAYEGNHAIKNDPKQEPIYDPGFPDCDSCEPSIYKIMQTFPDFDTIDKNIKKVYPNEDGWSETYPFWATKTVDELFDAFGPVRWASLVKHFKLKNKAFNFANYEKKTIYFKPTCKPVESDGTSGFNNLGILAKYPKLVK